MRPLGLYVHFPWCERRCPYCDFNTYVPDGDDPPHRAYADAVIEELHHRARTEFTGRTLQTLYFGGGTPGLWAADELERVAAAARDRFARIGAVDVKEVTVECNPSSSQRERFVRLVRAGVDRFSIGCQSFQDGTLQALGRLHDGETARPAVNDARDAGAARVSVDLLFGCPGQTIDTLTADLETVVALRPDHVSTYSLTVEPGTPFDEWRDAGSLALPTDDESAVMLDRIEACLETAGYSSYEISNWALPGARAVHNTGYWLGREYLGLGAGAHSLRREPGTAYRRVNALFPAAYLAAPAAPVFSGSTEPQVVPSGPRGLFPDHSAHRAPIGYRVDGPTLLAEDIVCGLRLSDGLDVEALTREHGVDILVERAEAVARGLRRGLVEIVGNRLRLTRIGRRFGDDVLATLL